MSKIVKKLQNIAKKKTKKELEEELALREQTAEILAEADTAPLAVDTASLPHSALAETVALGAVVATDAAVAGTAATVATATAVTIPTWAYVAGGVALLGGVGAAAGGGGGSTPPPPSDTTAPTLTSSIPTDDSTSFASNSNIILTFSEDVKAGSGNIVITNEVDANDTRTISITDAQVTISGNTVTINPTIDLIEGANYHITIASGVITDMAGNAYAGISDTTVLNFVTTVADNTAPTVESFSSSTANGNYNAGDAINITATMSETVTAGSTFDVTLDTGDVVTLTTTSVGTALTGTYTVGTGDNSIDLTVSSFAAGTVADTAGNVMSSMALPATNIADGSDIVIDTLAPEVISFTSSTANGNYNVGDAINITATMSETVTAGSTFDVTLDTGDVVTLTTTSAGTALSGIYTIGAGDNSSDLTVSSYTAGIVTDMAGNVMSSMALPATNIADGSDIVIDTTPPVAGTLSFSGLTDTGSNDTPDITADNLFSLTLEGNEAGSSVEYQYSKDDGVWTPTASDQNFIQDGDYEFRAVVTDVAGNSSTTDAISMTVDQVEPSAPLISSVYDNTVPITGNVSYNGYTNDTTPTLSGTAEANSTVKIYDNGIYADSVTTAADGEWTFTTSSVIAGVAHEFTATATDAAGNISTTSTGYIINIDTLAPSAPYISSIIDNVDPVQGTVSNGGYTNDTILTLSGSAEVNSTVTIYDNGLEIGSVTAAADGAWTFTTSSLTNGTMHEFATTATDAAGNVSSSSASYTINVDTLVPTSAATGAVTTNDIDTNQIYSAGDTIIIKFSEPVETSSITLANLALPNGHLFGTGATISAVNESGGFATSFLVTLGSDTTVAGSDTITISPENVVDIAGNAALSSVIFTLPATIGAPTVTITDDESDTGNIAGGDITYTFTFSEDVTGFTADDITVANGAKGTFSGSGNIYTLVVTPTAGYEGDMTVTVPADVATNSASNGNIEATSTQAVDTVAPMITSADIMGLNENFLTSVPAYTITATDDIYGAYTYGLGGGIDDSKFTINSSTGQVKFVTSPDYENPIDSNGDNSYEIAVTATDEAGNMTLKNVSIRINDVDDTPPVLVSSLPANEATGIPANANIVLTFDEDVQAGSGNIVISNGTDIRTISITDAQVTISGDTVTINPTNALNESTNYHITIASGVIKDIAGNAYAGISDTTALNFTTTVADYTPPEMIDMYFATGTTTTLTIVFDEDISLGNGNIEFYLNGRTEITPQSINISGSTVTVTFDMATTADDYIFVNADTGCVVDIAGNAVEPGSVAVGTQGNDIDLDVSDFNAVCSGITPYSDHITIVGSNGDDNITGNTYSSNNEYDYIVAGEGADTVDSSWGADTIILSELNKARDVVRVMTNEWDSSSNLNNVPYNIDTVIDFDTTSATPANHDALGFAVVQIADDGTYGGGAFSVTDGIVSFSSAPSTIEDGIALLQAHLDLNDIVGIKFDSDNDGDLDSMMVYQKTENSYGDPAVILYELQNIDSVTLGTAAGAGVVQIIDVVALEPNGADFTGGDLHIPFPENITSSNLAGNVTLYENGISTLTTGNDAISISGTNVTINTDSISTTDYLVITRNEGVTGDLGFYDEAGNIWSIMDNDIDGIVLGNTNTATINLSGINGNYEIANFLSSVNSTIIGTSGNNMIEGGSGADTIIGGMGVDDIMVGNGDTVIYNYGDSPEIAYDGLSTFCFEGGQADTVDLYNLESGDSIEIDLPTNMTYFDGEPENDQFTIVTGWYNEDNGAFVTNWDGSGNDTMVVYDGDSSSNVSLTAFVMLGASNGNLELGSTENILIYSVPTI